MKPDINNNSKTIQIYSCPVCDSNQFNFLSPVWKSYYTYNIKDFYLSPKNWFAECETCGCITVLPLIDYQEEFTKYGEAYYNQRGSNLTLESHAQQHFENYQKHNYDSIHTFLQRTVPSKQYPKWLDVGAVGYATTFNDYNFTTIEPDRRVVELGRNLFQSQKIFCHTLETFETKNVWDGILFNNSFYCVSTPKRTLSKAHSILKNGGYLIITISTYFHDATQNHYDGKFITVEDVLPGETLVIHYNPFALEYLLLQLGFELISSSTIPAYGQKTMKVYVFRKVTKSFFRSIFQNNINTPRQDLLTTSKQYQDRKWQECFQNFEESTIRTLTDINNNSTVMIGSLNILSDLLKYNPLDKIIGFITYPEPYSDCFCKGIRLISIEDLAELVQNPNQSKLYIVICSFNKDQLEIVELLQARFSQKANIFCPVRLSGMNFIFFQFGGSTQPSKSFVLKQI